MSDLDNKKRTLNDLPGLVEVHAVEVGIHKRAPRTDEHNAAISKAKKEYYASDAGLAERQSRSERMKEFWASPAGLAKKERLRQKFKKD